MFQLFRGELLSGHVTGANDAHRFLGHEIRTLQAGLLIGVAVCFGGGGSSAGLANFVVQLTALVLLALNRTAVIDFFRNGPTSLRWLMGAAILWPLLQTVPLPPPVWQMLPGRDLVHASLALINRQDEWFPMSVHPRRTLVAFFSLLPPLATVILGWRLPGGEMRKLLLLVVASGIVVALLGAEQLAFGNRHLMLYADGVGSADLQGTFANRNTAGLFLGLALAALMALVPTRSKPVWVVGAVVLAVLLLVGVVLTRSRSSMVLCIVPAAMFMLRLWWEFGRRLRARSLAGGMLLAGLLVAAAMGFASTNQRIVNSLSRFDTLQNVRVLIWSDTLGSINHFWPVGSGVGTFDEVFQVDESLENLSPGRAGRAHDDYLEATLESGLVGIALLVAWLLVVVALSWRALRCGSVLMWAGVGILGMIALQSIIDYPLRNQTLLCIAGLALAQLASALAHQAGKRSSVSVAGGVDKARRRSKPLA